MSQAILECNCPDLKLISRGKVRELYDIDEESLLFVATDRLSAYDVIMKNGIPGKGKILTQMSVFWFNLLKDVMKTHLITANIDEMPACVQKYRDQLEGRSMLVKKLSILPIEAIVRGYITGSGWAEYKRKGTVCDIPLPKELKESQKLPEPLFTPSTKAEYGEHDENIHPSKVAGIIGEKYAKQMEEAALKVYKAALSHAEKKGIIIADTKFEFGTNKDGEIVLADEVLTPDSSRFWPADSYEVGKGQNSYDKQYVRDYLTSINFDKKTPIELPQDIIDKTVKKYVEAYTRLTGEAPKL
ncbi:SAICAR synthetase [Neocallimastix lanati (nom. inval.)]|jgi:phosphoribosylaminoimidazole-succinocarboxamide synthase|uniref:Phosphoribosylaminoimidazole-succinocarboxamide synthase n=1 Tax=Neocallimastix californiae TaxID=1754190 RepID=A0A1Y2BU57_9FUNG|nr:SAICAR synthetase [Neocallimastix sp. JGI-2020a]ORY38298.1 SAICAR synthetase [Neocallimastix californiae]|eukprot:ORY38298.1 SAICAR synthetase [Neocallimastix californiae]